MIVTFNLDYKVSDDIKKAALFSNDTSGVMVHESTFTSALQEAVSSTNNNRNIIISNMGIGSMDSFTTDCVPCPHCKSIKTTIHTYTIDNNIDDIYFSRYITAHISGICANCSARFEMTLTPLNK